MANPKISTTKTLLDVEHQLARGLVATMLAASMTMFGFSLAIGWLGIVYVNNPLTGSVSVSVPALPEAEASLSAADLTVNYQAAVGVIHREVFASLRGTSLTTADPKQWDAWAVELRNGTQRLLKLTVPSDDRALHLSMVLFYEQTIEEINSGGSDLRERLLEQLAAFEQARPQLTGSSR